MRVATIVLGLVVMVAACSGSDERVPIVALDAAAIDAAPAVDAVDAAPAIDAPDAGPRCGDGDLDPGELCDDGNTDDFDGCRNNCRSDNTCGNGAVDNELPRNRTTDPGSCLNATTQHTGCAEVCDDGNNVSGDGCSANCLSEEQCGNGIVDMLGNGGHGHPFDPPEYCDDGNVNDYDACPNNCQSDADGWQCGDGVVYPLLEDCDTSGDSATCDADCTPPVCGDGHVNAAAGEACDPGTPHVDAPGCDRDCTLPVCGDGVVNTAAGEQCEPPGVGACNASCHLS